MEEGRTRWTGTAALLRLRVWFYLPIGVSGKQSPQSSVPWQETHVSHPEGASNALFCSYLPPHPVDPSCLLLDHLTHRRLSLCPVLSLLSPDLHPTRHADVSMCQVQRCPGARTLVSPRVSGSSGQHRSTVRDLYLNRLRWCHSPDTRAQRRKMPAEPPASLLRKGSPRFLGFRLRRGEGVVPGEGLPESLSSGLS